MPANAKATNNDKAVANAKPSATATVLEKPSDLMAFSSAWHRIGNDCHKTLNRFWRHSDLIEVKDGRYESAPAAWQNSPQSAAPNCASSLFRARRWGARGKSAPHRPRHTAIIHRQWSERASSDKEGGWIPHHSASELGGGSYNRPYFRNGRSGVLHLLRRDARGLATFATNETLWSQ